MSEARRGKRVRERRGKKVRLRRGKEERGREAQEPGCGARVRWRLLGQGGLGLAKREKGWRRETWAGWEEEMPAQQVLLFN